MGNENFEILFPVLGTDAYGDPETPCLLVGWGGCRGGAIRSVLRSTSRLALEQSSNRAKDREIYLN